MDNWDEDGYDVNFHMIESRIFPFYNNIEFAINP